MHSQHQITSSPGAISRRVLIADDDQDTALSLRVLLELQGHTVFTAFSGTDALELADKEHPEAAVLDIAMPGLDGCAVAECIRQRSWGRGVTLIAASGYGQIEDLERAKAAGFDHYLLKPMEPDTINRLIGGVGPNDSTA
jgi:CheY-like chemotaxis protein